MSKVTYQAREFSCEQSFICLGHVYHLYTSENHPSFLLKDEDFIKAMNIFGLVCANWRKHVRVLTFQLMSNHFHIIACGQPEDLKEMLRLYKLALTRSLESEHVALLEFNLTQISSLDYARKCIAYVNRNGYLVSHDWIPMTYPWGANRFYFNNELKSFHIKSGNTPTIRDIRLLTKSRKYDSVRGALMVQGTISPVSYCDVAAGEKLFRDTRQYFQTITKNVEGLGEIAAQIGETAFLTDAELFRVLTRILAEEFHSEKVSELDGPSRIAVAKKLRYSCNASNKQLCRLLNLPSSSVSALFGE